MRKLNSIVFVMIGSLSAVPTQASGFAFYENAAKASAQGGAWVARADDASANWCNPGALVHLDGGELQLGLNDLDSGSDWRFSPAPGVSFGADAMHLTFDDVTANGLPSDGAIPGTYSSAILLAGVTAKYRD